MVGEYGSTIRLLLCDILFKYCGGSEQFGGNIELDSLSSLVTCVHSIRFTAVEYCYSVPRNATKLLFDLGPQPHRMVCLCSICFLPIYLLPCAKPRLCPVYTNSNIKIETHFNEYAI